MSTENLPQKLILKLPTNFPHVFLTEVNSTFTTELGRINNELNKKLTTKINSREAGYSSEAQKIFSMVNNATRLDTFEKVRRNEFGRISSEFNASIEALRNEMIQSYAIVQRDFDQLSVANQSEASTDHVEALLPEILVCIS